MQEQPTDVLIGGRFISRSEFDRFNEWLEAKGEPRMTAFTRADYEASVKPQTQPDMQELIKGLAKSCGFIPDGKKIIDPDGGDMTQELTAFAQAVAMECAQVADEALTKGRSPMGRVAAQAISARFGLEG